MDPNGLEVVRQSMRSAATRGRGVVFSTQLLEQAERVADRVVILRDGKVAAQGTMQELTAGGEGLEDMFRHLREGS
jgi:ABC-2 type transport system ATP-binding protein